MEFLVSLLKQTTVRMLVSLPVISMAWLLVPTTAKAQNVVCNTFSMPNVNFGSFTPFDAPASTSGQLSFQCYNTTISLLGITSIYAAICINFGAGSAGGTAAARNMSTTGSLTPLQYQIYRSDGAVWGSYNLAGSSPPQIVLELPSAWLVNGIFGSYNYQSATLPFTASIGSGQSTTIPGTYRSDFSTTQASIIVRTGSSNTVTCTGQSTSSANVVLSQATLSFSVTATVQKACQIQISSASNMDFGNINPLTTGPFDTSSSLNARCTSTTPYNIALEPSGTPTPTDGKGTLRNAGTASNNPDTYVSYGLYRDVGRSLPWGNVSNSNTLGGTGTGSYAASPINIYGRINNGNVRPGSYTDNVLVNVLY